LRSQNGTMTLAGGAGLANDPRCERGIRGFLELEGSTTFYLESLGGREIHVSVLGQRTVGQNGGGEIYRESLLHPADGRDPILHSVCRLRSDKLTPEEVEKVLAGGTPLAKIFDPVDNGRLRKANGTLRHGVDAYAARRLGTTSTICYSRTYELMVDGEVVGTISETLNEESMARAFR
jgi:chorismate-pyruvate lyase